MSVRLGTCRVFEEDGRWHVGELQPTGLFGAGDPKWGQVTFVGYRSRKRAERRAARVQAKNYRWRAKWERQQAERVASRDATDARIRNKVAR